MGRRRLWLAAVVAVALGAAVFAACGGGGDAETATPTPTPPAGVTPLPETPTPTPQPHLAPTSYRFLYSEFGAEADVIWSIDPADPADRVQVASVPHKTGWGIKPALSPDGAKIAYNVMPEEGASASTDAETHILDLKAGETELVAQRVDLQTTPRWAPDSGLLFLRQNVDEEVTVILVQLFETEEEREGTPVSDEEMEEEPPPIRTILRQHQSDVLAYIPLGVDPEEAALYFIQIQGGTESGSYLGRYSPATGEAVATATAVANETATAAAATATPTPTPTPTPAASPTPTPTPLTGDVFLVLSDQIVPQYALSPDASRLAYIVPGLVQGQFVARTNIADIKGKQVSPLPSPEGLSSGDQLSPTWHPEGDRVSVGQLPSGANPGRVATVPLDGGEPSFLPAPEQGFDEPLSWSPDGKFLAVNSFPGGSVGNPGQPRLVFVAPTGQRPAAPAGAEFEPIGWVKEQ